jgi:hypothetical protein
MNKPGKRSSAKKQRRQPLPFFSLRKENHLHASKARDGFKLLSPDYRIVAFS